MKKLKYVKLFEDYVINEEGIFGNLFGGGKKEEPKSDPLESAKKVWKPLLDKFFPNNTFDIQDFNRSDPQKRESASNLYRFCELLKYHTEPDSFYKQYGMSLENFFAKIKLAIEHAIDYHYMRFKLDEKERENFKVRLFSTNSLTDEEYDVFEKNGEGMRKTLPVIREQLMSFHTLYELISTGESYNLKIDNKKLGSSPFDGLNSLFNDLTKNNQDASDGRRFMVKFTRYAKQKPHREIKSDFDFTYLLNALHTWSK